MSDEAQRDVRLTPRTRFTNRELNVDPEAASPFRALSFDGLHSSKGLSHDQRLRGVEQLPVSMIL